MSKREAKAQEYAAWVRAAEKESKKSADDLRHPTLEGIDLKPLYCQSDVSSTQQDDFPGFPPYKRGVRATMYTGRPWTIRQYAGFSTAEESNAFYRSCLADGQSALSVAFDLATHRGYDSDHPRVSGDVGKAGVAIDSVGDMERLFAGINLADVSVSMTMNGAVLPVLAFYIVAAEKQGVSAAQLRGTIQNDILKEFLVRNTYIYPPAPSMRIVGDIIAYCAEHLPLFNPISISGYHMHEAGATAVQELAYTLANGRAYLEAALAKGLSIDSFAPRLSFFFGIGMNFFMEVAKLRAARVLWAEIVSAFSPQKPESLMLRTHCQTSGVSLTVQDPYNNIVRTTVEAMASILGGTQSLHTNAFDEALGLPTPESARVARHTQLILTHETKIPQVIDPLGGSYYVENLTDTLVQEAKKLIADVDAVGGMVPAIEGGIPQRAIEESATNRQVRWDTKQDIIVGVNAFEQPDQAEIPVLKIDANTVRSAQTERLKHIRETRNAEHCEQALLELAEAARANKENLLKKAIEAARCNATLGEISAALETVYGRHRATVRTVRHIIAQGLKNDPRYQKVCHKIQQFAVAEGRQPRILLSKLGQDGHDRGIKIVASAFADCGFTVDLTPLFLTPAEAARQAVDNDVHIIGISSLVAGHTTLIPELMAHLKALDATDIQVICGGILPPQDHQFLLDQGVRLIFIPGTSLIDMMESVVDILSV